MKVVFLDIDGILTNRESIKKIYEYYKKFKTLKSEVDEKMVKKYQK